MWTRRRFVRATLLGSALLGLAGVVGRHLSGYALDETTARKLRAMTPKEYLIFRAAARRILAGDAADAPSPDTLDVALRADAYLAKLDPALRRECRALFHLLEHGGSLRGRFTRLSPEAQDAVLTGWERSSLTVRRQGLQALRSLAFFAYYSHDSSWRLLGYSGPMLPKKS